MSVIKAINRKAPARKGADYVLGKAVLAEGVNCRAETWLEESRVTQAYYGKYDGQDRYYHYVKSYPPGEVSPAEAMAEAREWVDRNPDLHGFEVLLAAHDDRDHCHVHMLVNAVCASDGHKLHVGKPRYRDTWLPLNRDIDIAHGRTVTERKRKTRGDVVAEDKRKFEVIRRKGADSDIGHVYMSVLAAKKLAANWDDFDRLLLADGVQCEHKPGRKHIVFAYGGHRYRVRLLSR